MRQRDDSSIAASTYVVVLGALALVPHFNPWLEGVWLALIVACLWKIGTTRGEAGGWRLPSILLGLAGLRLFAPEVVAIIAGLVAPAAGLVAYYSPARRREVALGALTICLAAIGLLTFLGRVEVMIGGVVGGLVGLASSAPERLRPSPRVLLGVLATSIGFLWLLHDPESLWLGYSLKLPGALAIRAVGRIVLILMIPAALGLAVLVEGLARDRSAALAWAVALVCLAEQTVTTRSFDAAANRSKIAEVAGRVAPGVETFYYKPAGNETFTIYGLDAIWASRAVGKPTINGYTGYYPADWYDFLLADSETGLPLPLLLERWEAKHGLRPEAVQRIDGPPGVGEAGRTPVAARASN
jgi:hypothetical protein